MTLTELLSLILRRPRRDTTAGRIPDLAFGDVGDPASFLIYVVFESDLPFELQAEAVRALWGYCQRIGHLALVTRRPDLYPCAYGEVRYGVPLGHTRDEFPPSGAGALSPVRWRQPWVDRYQSMAILIDLTHAVLTPDALARAALHEVGHGLGWPATHVPTEYSPEWWELCRAGAPDAAARAARWRTVPASA